MKLQQVLPLRQFISWQKAIPTINFARRNHSSNDAEEKIRLIKQHTSISRQHLTPEICLHLITPSSLLWSAMPEDVPFNDPFWAFYWPGGQAVARYILDNPGVVAGKRVLDVGSGSGACAIAAAMSFSSVTANDIDELASLAIVLNSKMNNVHVEVNTSDLIGGNCHDWDCILCGDMFYDVEFAARLLPWLSDLCRQGKIVLVGDPGRHALKDNIENRVLKCMAEYNLAESSCLENRGFTSACVWKLIK